MATLYRALLSCGHEVERKDKRKIKSKMRCFICNADKQLISTREEER